MLQFAKMKKCEFCDRSFGQEAFGRHSLHCGKGFSCPHRQHGQEDTYVIKSDDFMQRLEDASLHAFVEEQTEDSKSQPSTEPEAKLSRFIVVNPSPRIIFQEIVQQQSRGSIVSSEYLPRRRRPSSPGKWRAVSRNKANRGH
jgi:hypothetical protein